MAYDHKGNPTERSENTAVKSQTLVGGTVDIRVVTSEIKSLDEIKDDDFVFILADNVLTTDKKYSILDHTISQVSLINMTLIPATYEERKHLTLHEIGHQFGPGDRGRKNDDGTGSNNKTDNLFDYGLGYKIDINQAAEIIANIIEQKGAQKKQ